MPTNAVIVEFDAGVLAARTVLKGLGLKSDAMIAMPGMQQLIWFEKRREVARAAEQLTLLGFDFQIRHEMRGAERTVDARVIHVR